MTQNIYDDPGFFAGYSQLQRSLEGLAGAPEWPSLQAMLPPLQGLRVVDLGCGFGWFCRFAREQGARQVLGVDVSANMLARAASMTDDPAIRYVQADLEQLALEPGGYELAYSSLALHYIADLPALLRAIHTGLVVGGKLVFSMEHPILTASPHQGWITDAAGRRRWPIDSYQLEGPRVTNWLADGVVKQHRTLGTLLNLLIRTGFVIDHVEEWGPSAAQVAARPALAEERDRPMMLLVGAHR